MHMAEQIKKVEGNPYFSTRVMQRLRNLESMEKGASGWQFSPAWKMAIAAILLAANTVTFIQFQSNSVAEREQVELVALASEYGIADGEMEYIDYLAVE